MGTQLSNTVRYRRRHLPHWEVEGGRYFVTVRCADSLPLAVVSQIQELHLSLSRVPPRSPQFAVFQRQIFRTLEKYLDAGQGSCPLRQPALASIVVEELEALADWQVATPHYTVMPNHWHALLVPRDSAGHSLSEIMKRLKGRTAKRIRTVIGGRGPIWQGEWFDRWVRDESEWTKMVAYVQNNPVKAGLTGAINEHPWTR